MAVPFIDLSRLVDKLRDDVLPDWKAVLEKCEFVGGPRVGALEKALSASLAVPHVVSCANGTDAILIGLQALGVGPGKKVALPNLTFWATYEAIAQLGATPVLVDVSPDDLQLSLAELKSAHAAHKLDAAILVHLYGWCSAELEAIRAFCKDNGIPLLEDGAQCYGVQTGGKEVLAGATIGTMSFYPAKVVGGAMDGGAITMLTPEHEKLVRSLCNHGRAEHYSYAHIGWNSRMGGVQAAFLNRVVALVPEILASRRKAALYYRERLAGNARITQYGPPAGVVENGYLNVFTVDGMKGDDVVQKLKALGIGAARTYPEPMSAQPPAHAGIRHGDLAHSKRICESVVNLPLFYGITEAECEESVKALFSVLG